MFAAPRGEAGSRSRPAGRRARQPSYRRRSGENVSGAGGSKVDDAVVISGLERADEAAP
jgi:hypothetical protein